MIRFWNRLLSLDDSRLTKRVFLAIHARNTTKWCRSLCDIMAETGMEDNFWYMMPCDLKLCLEKLMDVYIKKWKGLLPRKPKLRTYITFKNHFFTENYVKINLDRNQRSVLSQLRCGILPLHLETGRFCNTKLEDRKCQICCTEAVETECHFLFDCSFYQTERNAFYESLLDYPNFLLLSEDKKLNMLFTFEPRKLAKYTVKILNKRQQKLIK